MNIDIVYLDMMYHLKKELIPYKTNLIKYRLGDEKDGSYVLCDGIESSGLYSYGSNNQIEFEKSFYEKYQKECWVYDHTISGISDKPDYIHFFKQGVSCQTTHELDTIDNQVAQNGHTGKCQNMFAQIDIEGCEWDILTCSNEIKDFAQVLIEFHMWNPNFVLNNFNKILNTFKFMNKYFVCVHIHGNNSPAIAPWLDINLPGILECTYVRKDLISLKEIDTQEYPTNLDFKNNKSRPDMPLNWWLDKSPPYICEYSLNC